MLVFNQSNVSQNAALPSGILRTPEHQQQQQNKGIPTEGRNTTYSKTCLKYDKNTRSTYILQILGYIFGAVFGTQKQAVVLFGKV